MRSVRTTFALLCVPRLFIHFLLGPILIGLGFVVFELLVVNLKHGANMSRNPKYLVRREIQRSEKNYFRELAYGEAGALGKLKVCRYATLGEQELTPPNCEVQPHDVAILVPDPQAFDASPYYESYSGLVRTLHVCKTCKADIVHDLRAGNPVTNIYNPKSIIILVNISTFDSKLASTKQNIGRLQEDVKGLLGNIYIIPDGKLGPIEFSTLTDDTVLILQIAMLVLIAMWYGLRSHEKILHYLSRNDAVVPLAAGVGMSTLYSVLWLLTLCRVFVFLLPSVPITYILINNLLKYQVLNTSLDFTGDSVTLWLIALLTGSAVPALLFSTADLRFSDWWGVLVFKILPALACIIGALMWLDTLFQGGGTSMLRDIITATPVVGFGAILFSPMLRIDEFLLGLHAIFAAALGSLLLIRNSRWFAKNMAAV